MADILPDLLAPGLRLVLCGSAAGTASARAGAYYAGPGNRFWQVLHRIGLTPCQLAPAQYPQLLEYRIGLTDAVKRRFGSDSQLRAADFAPDRLGALLRRYRPGALAFNGKRAAQAFLGGAVSYGLQGNMEEDTALFVLPSTSGAARAFWNEDIWRQMAQWIQGRDNNGFEPRTDSRL
ncbi:MAG: mismatch-specific DNA-glycosylase [Candidatus Latescibacteria bacterium]|nr:mismatch-specific DNA-glycosylase [Candidatus Latescibacterota bacterium]